MIRRTTHAYDTTIVAACPKCRTCLALLSFSTPQVDSCGFESYSFQCELCKVLLRASSTLWMRNYSVPPI